MAAVRYIYLLVIPATIGLMLLHNLGDWFRKLLARRFGQTPSAPPVSDLTSPLFGYSTQTLASSLGSGGANGGFSPLYQIGGPRSV